MDKISSIIHEFLEMDGACVTSIGFPAQAPSSKQNMFAILSPRIEKDKKRRNKVKEKLNENNILCFEYEKTIDPKCICKDNVIIIPILNDSFAFNILSDIGTTIEYALHKGAKIIVYIEDIDPEYNIDERYVHSNNMRIILRKFITNIKNDNIALATDVDDMINIASRFHNEIM